MVKIEMVSNSDFDVFIRELIAVLRFLAKEHGDNSIISMSHTTPCEATPKFIALITYKARS
ncbi:hypothetical protein KTI59_12880 [Acinetobacter radioresistens]|uniref:hypothetical protein n=1 Tax=Acinetobacter radioresistens TaxID=40216 RepID=UPI0021CD652F|nr:hypothetical protein [Acinetobacter radioresistens]MCU4500982.1 hypothetical protein [Acinetobacter radioresistens]